MAKRVRLNQPLVFNVSGFDRLPREFPAGEQDAPDSLAAWLLHNPGVGEVLGEAAGDGSDGGTPPSVAALVAGTADQVAARVAAVKTAADLDAIEQAEQARPRGARQKVLAALEARRAELSGDGSE